MKQRIISFFLFSTIFLNASVLFKSPFEGYSYYVIGLVASVFFIYRQGLPKLPFKLLSIPIVLGAVYVILGYSTPFALIKIAGGMLFLMVFYIGMIEYYDRDVVKLFQVYLSWSRILAIIGLLQIVFYIVGFSPGYNFDYLFNKWSTHEGSLLFIRLNSFFAEPSQFAITIAPAVFISVRNLMGEVSEEFKEKRYMSILMIAAYVLTTSSVAFLGLMLILLIVWIEKRRFTYLLSIFLIIPTLVVVLYRNVDEFKVRFDSLYGLVVENDFSIENVNNSSFVLYNNFVIAWNNFLDHPLGTGLGSHEFAFDKYSLTRSGNIFQLDFNKKDANSSFSRILSEMGILGISFLVFVLIKFYVRGTDKEAGQFKQISQALLVLMILHLFRQGNYFLNGAVFFFLLYYYNALSKQEFFEERQEKEESAIANPVN